MLAPNTLKSLKANVGDNLHHWIQLGTRLQIYTLSPAAAERWGDK